MTSEKGRQVIENGWKSAGIIKALTKGDDGLDPLDPFPSVDPLDSSTSVNNVFYHPQPTIGPGELANFISARQDTTNSDSDDEWEEINISESRNEAIANIFDVLDDETW